MQIAQVLSGYTLGEADMLRRAMGKKIKAEMDAQRERFVNGAVERELTPEPGQLHLRPAGEIRRLRLQQEPCGGLCADRLSDRLVQGALSGGVSGRLDDLRQEPDRQARRIPRRGAAPGHRGRAAVDQALGRRFRRRARRRRQARDPLRALGDQGRRRGAGGVDRALARRDAPLRASRISPGGSIRARSTRRCWRISPPAAPSTSWSPIAPAPSRAIETILAARQSPRRGPQGRARMRCSARPRPTELVAAQGRSPGRRRRRCDANMKPPAFSSPAIRSTPMPASYRKLRVSRWTEFVAAVKRGATAGRLAAVVLDRAERRTKSGLEDGHRPALGRQRAI